jgi:hypothetical protein
MAFTALLKDDCSPGIGTLRAGDRYARLTTIDLSVGLYNFSRV